MQHWINNMGGAMKDLNQTVKESLTAQDHIRDATKMVALTTEQAQQIEEALEDIVRVFKFETGTPVEALATIRAARAQEQAEQEPSVSDGLCGGCAKKAADGWALYCVECWENGNGQSAINEPAANAHVSNADSDSVSDVNQEPVAWDSLRKIKTGDNIYEWQYIEGWNDALDIAEQAFQVEPVSQEQGLATTLSGQYAVLKGLLRR